VRAVIVMNGSINAGKSSVGACVAALLPRAAFLEGDDHDAPDDAPLTQRIEAAWRRIEAQVAADEADYLVVAYPVDELRYEALSRACARKGATLFLVTLAPPLEIALSDRGARRLSAQERKRIQEMYVEGYPVRAFSDLVIDNSRISIEKAAELVARRVLETVATG